MKMTLGPLMVGIEGLQLTHADTNRLLHHSVGGVLLFQRNFSDIEQLQQLTSAIHALRQPRLLIAVDQEGGKIQRFGKPFTTLPSMQALGQLHDEEPAKALRYTEAVGWMMAAELISCGLDVSFSPVVDIDFGNNPMIGSRSLHHNPSVVAKLAGCLSRGMRSAGMEPVAKHFPGHGYVHEDSHHLLPEDWRSIDTFRTQDFVPYHALISDNLAGIMMAHLTVPQFDNSPASISQRWIQLLRNELGFQGCIFSDDLTMKALSYLSPVDRITRALQSGCDMALYCNDLDTLDACLQQAEFPANPTSNARLIRYHAKHKIRWADLQENAHWQQYHPILESML